MPDAELTAVVRLIHRLAGSEPRDAELLGRSLARLDDFALADPGTAQAAGAAADRGTAYPDSELAGRLRLMARLLKSGFGARVLYAQQGS